MPKISWIGSAVSIELRLLTDRQTDGHMTIANTALARRCARKDNHTFVYEFSPVLSK